MRVVDHYIDSKIFSINYFSFPFRIWVLGFIFSVIGIGFPIIGILLSLFPFWLYAVSKNMVWLKMIKHKVINKTLISSLCKRFVFNLSYPPTLIGIVGVIYIIVSITVELFSGARISYILNSSEHFGIKIFIFTPFIAASLIKTLVNATEDEVLV